jgi:hypothetical protein
MKASLLIDLESKLNDAGCARKGISLMKEVGEHAFPLAIRRGWISPEPREVRRHGAEPRADRIVEDELILASRLFPFLARPA